MINNNRNREKGFTLIEVIIAGGIMLVIAAGFTSMITNQSHVVKQMELKIQKSTVSEQVTKFYSDAAECTLALAGETLPNIGGFTNLPNISLAGGLTLTSNAALLENGLMVGDIKIKNISTATTPSGQALLKVEVPFYTMNNNSKVYYNSHEVDIVTSTAGGIITGCDDSDLCLDPDDGTYKEKKITLEKDTQVCNQGKWITTAQGCDRSGNYYSTGQTRRSGGSLFTRSRKYICIDGTWASAGR